jgi:uroporphyrinogen decarboxylase
MKINMTQWRQLLFEQTKRTAMPIMTHPGIEVLGNTIRQAVSDGKTHYQVVKKITDLYESCAITMMMDLSVEAEAFGAPVKFFDHETPSVTAVIAGDAHTAARLHVPDMNAGRLRQYIIAASLISANIVDRPVLGCCLGPFSLASRLYGLTEIMTAILTEPEVIHLLLEKCTSFLTMYVQKFKSAGTNGLVMAEPASGMLPEDLCAAFSSQYVKRIVDTVQDDTFMFVLHNCGDTNSLLNVMQETGAAGLHFGNKCDIVRALDIIDSRVVVFGNLDPVEVFKEGTPENIRSAVLDLLAKTSRHKNFVLSSGCDLPPGVPPKNIDAFFAALEEYNSR